MEQLKNEIPMGPYKTWQIVELVAALFSIPLSFGFAILLTGDGDKVYNFYFDYFLPALVLLALFKIFVTVALYQQKYWSIKYNYYRYVVLTVLFVFPLFAGFIAFFTVENYTLLQAILAMVYAVPPLIYVFMMTKKYKKLIG